MCLLECQGGSSANIDTNCTTILGRLAVANPGPKWVTFFFSDWFTESLWWSNIYSSDDLLKLTTIRHITGSLSIELFNSPDLFPYLSNLETVGNDSNEVVSFLCNGSSSSSPYSIYITGTDLVGIDLSSLREINGGGVSIDNNPSLCFVGDFSRYITNSSADYCTGEDYRRPSEECSELLSCSSMTCVHTSKLCNYVNAC